MAAVDVCAADTDREAERLFTSIQQSFVALRRGTPGPLPPPVESIEGLWSPVEAANVGHAFREAIIGSPEKFRRGLEAFLGRTEADELMLTGALFDHGARLRSFEIAAGAAGLPRS